MLNMKHSQFLIVLFAAAGALQLSCSGGNDEASETTFDIDFNLPASIDAEAESEVTFSVKNGKSPLTSDIMMFTSSSGISKNCGIVESSASSFTVKLAKGLESGQYTVYMKRNDRKKSFGSTYLNIVKAVESEIDESTTVWGVVTSGDQGIPGVVVSDGILVTTTDDNGIYQLASEKKWGYVFISIPSGYEVPSEGVIPQFHHYLRGSAKDVERSDFELVKVSGQDSHKMFFLGDMHLANRTGDRTQFTRFTDDWNKYMDNHKTEKMYAMSLGDMTWDIYWYSNGYEFPQYLDEINSKVSGIQVFHTMGNHDNDYKALNDFDAEITYVKSICPKYYSFNIGKIHYIVLDDIDCSAYDGSESRNYTKSFSQEQLDWLEKDLAYVSKSTPLIITTHAQIFYPDGVSAFKIDHNSSNTAKFFNIVKGYKAHIVTGHTHTIFNVTPEEAAKLGADNIYEHNAGSVCASWWWSGYLTSGVWVSLDGEPGGYSIWDINGTDIKWVYKATGWDESYQFRSYDLNKVSFSMSDVPNMPSNATITASFKRYVDAYPGTANNEVLINIWNWSSKWSLKVTDESGRTLPWTQCVAYDPLHIAALSVKRFNSQSISSVPNFITEKKMPHFFKVKADNADEDLTITVTDEFGNVYTESMSRPKAFNVSDFAK